MISGYIVSGILRTPLFAEGMSDAEVIKCVVSTGIDSVDNAALKLPPTNLAARSLLQKNAVVEIRDGSEVIFVGDVAQVTQSEDGSVQVELDGALGGLQNITKPPFKVEPTDPSGPVESFLDAIIDQYNAAVSTEHVIQLGVVTVAGSVQMNHLDSYTRMLDLLREVHEQLGGHYYMSYAGGLPTLHYVAEPSTESQQVLELGVNVLTVENQLDFSEFASRVYATGTYYVTQTVDGKEQREQRSLNAGYVVDTDAESAFGRVDYPYRSGTDMGGDKDAGIADKTEAEARAIILAEAQAELDERKTPLQSLSMTAVDLADVGANYRLFHVGTVARAVIRTLRIDTRMVVRSVRRDLINRADSVVTFGRMPRTLTGML